MSDTGELLVQADHRARDILLDTSPGYAPLLLAGWVEAMDCAATFWDALPARSRAIPGDPLAQIGASATSIHRDIQDRAQGVEPRMLQIADLFSQATGQLTTQQPGQMESARLGAGLLHTCYLATHAVATSTSRHADRLVQDPDTAALGRQVLEVSDRVRGAEQVLDAYLHQSPTLPPMDQASPATALARAMTGWNVALHQMARNQPDPKNWHVVAQVSIDVLTQTARIITASSSGVSNDVHQRLLPALNQARRAWSATRHQWGVLASPDTPISRPLITAGRQLQRALRDPSLIANPHTPNVLTIGLVSGFEAAALAERALADPNLRAPADTVVALTQRLVDRQCDAGSTIWHSFERIEGRAPIPVPVALRDDMARTAAATTTAARTACSAGHSMLDTSSYTTDLAFHTSKSTASRPRQPIKLAMQQSAGSPDEETTGLHRARGVSADPLDNPQAGALQHKVSRNQPGLGLWW